MTLYLDFETSPIIGAGWRMYTKGQAFFHILKDIEIISVAYCEDDGPIYCVSIDEFPGYKTGFMNVNDKKLVEFFAPKFEKADYVIAQNGKGFDFKLWRTRLIKHGMTPHHEPIEMDTKQWANKFYFASKSQDNITRELGVARKMETEKYLHEKCIDQGDPRAWKQMRAYNKQDVKGLREMAKRMAPFITTTPNANVSNGTLMECRNLLCPGGGKMIRRGSRPRSKTGKVQDYQCTACGTYSHGPIIQSGVLLR